MPKGISGDEKIYLYLDVEIVFLRFRNRGLPDLQLSGTINFVDSGFVRKDNDWGLKKYSILL